MGAIAKKMENKMNNKIKSINNKISKLQQETRALIKQRDEELEKDRKKENLERIYRKDICVSR